MSASVVRWEAVESLLRFDGMLGVLTSPDASDSVSDLGVVIVVGGPQTRVGSHRQFVTLARALADAGYPCLRFDYTGMGDSPGPMPDFERAGPDIGLACDALQREVPQCRRIVLWGLCEGATAALFRSVVDARIAGVVVANPWARSDATRSAALVSQHYGSRLRSREFWTKLVAGRVDVLGSAREAVGHLRTALRVRNLRPEHAPRGDLPARVARALHTSGRPVRLQLSGNDLTAAEFELALAPFAALDAPNVSCLRLEHADHTCSNPDDWQAALADTIAFLRGLQAR